MKPLTPGYVFCGGLLVLCALTWMAYVPGLSGGFLFDDFINLDALGNDGAINNWPVFWRYVTSGSADPVGRPLALLSFLIDARNWPADPAPFLRTNLLLHLANGGLLFALLRRLGALLGDDGIRNDAVALLAAGMWLLHPLFVSTTLYVVQREAILPTTFSLLGLLAFARGRDLFARTQGQAGTPWMAAGICLGTLLATLSKANGLLLPLLAWVLEATVFAQAALDPATAAAAKLRRVKWVLLVLPGLAVLTYVLHFLPDLHASIDRPWTISQRLLTEPRVLLDYLKLLIVPHSVSSGLYNDDYPVSLSLWQPADTLPALLVISGLVWLAVRVRRTAPDWSAAILFFFAGHVLESSAVPLELYFEHRNYLPALLLFWPLARTICALRSGVWLRAAIAAVILSLLALTTYQRAELWGRPDRLSALWLQQNPHSSRALATMAMQMRDSGEPQRALDLLAPIRAQRPYDLQIAFNYVDVLCAGPGLQRPQTLALAEALQRSTDRQDLAFRWLADALEDPSSNHCPGMSVDDIELWVESAEKNPAFRGRAHDQNLQSLRGQIALKQGQPELALEHFNLALQADVRPEVAASQAAMLASLGYNDQASAHLDKYDQIKSQSARPGMGMPWLHAKVLQWQDYWPRELSALRAVINQDIGLQRAVKSKPIDSSIHE